MTPDSYFENGTFGNIVSFSHAVDFLTEAPTNQPRGSSVCGGAVVYGTQWTDGIYLHVQWA